MIFWSLEKNLSSETNQKIKYKNLDFVFKIEVIIFSEVIQIREKVKAFTKNSFQLKSCFKTKERKFK
jgi:hypothetical protein